MFTYTHARRRILAAGTLFLVGMFAAAGCGSSSDDSTPESDSKTSIKTIAYADPLSANPQFKAVGDSLVAAAEAQGIEVFRFDNKFDPATTLSNAKLMLQKKPDLIVNWSAAESANTAVGKLYQDAGIPCVALNVAIPGCSLFNQRSKDLGANEAKVAAAEVKKRGWTAEDTTLLLAWAPAVGKDVNELATFFYSDFAKEFPDMKQVEPSDISLSTAQIDDNAIFVDGGAQLQQTNTAVKQALGAIPEGRHIVVLVFNDDSGLGAKQALSSAGRENDALIVSNVASESGLKELRTNPNWIADGSVFFVLWGRYGLAMGMAMADGQKLPDLTVAPTAVLTKENVDTYYNESEAILAPEYLPENEYLKPYIDQLGGPLDK